jgi:hypothetical protein
MGCPILQFNANTILTIFNAAGGVIRVGQDATIEAQAWSPGAAGDPGRAGTIRFFWQPSGTMEFLPLPAAAGSESPAPIFMPNGSSLVPPGGIGVATMLWLPTQAIVGVSNPAIGKLWATIWTTAIIGECGANSPAPPPTAPCSMGVQVAVFQAQGAQVTQGHQQQLQRAPAAPGVGRRRPGGG